MKETKWSTTAKHTSSTNLPEKVSLSSQEQSVTTILYLASKIYNAAIFLKNNCDIPSHPLTNQILLLAMQEPIKIPPISQKN